MTISSRFNGCWIALLFILGLTTTALSTTIRVDQNAPTNIQNGNSWNTAYLDLQSALSAARNNNSIDEIWVAAGTYLPTSGTDRTIAFELVSGVKIYGGFSGSESLLEERNPDTNICILSGDIGTPNDASDNSYHIVTFTQVGQDEVLLNGFHLKGGQAAIVNSYPNDRGGAIFIEAAQALDTLRLRIEECTFTDNYAIYGAAIALNVSDDAVILDTLENLHFSSNSVDIDGAALFQYKGNRGQIMSYLLNTVFLDNSAGRYGGAIGHDGNGGSIGSEIAPNLLIVNAIFSRNVANRGGCLMSGDDTNAFIIIRNSTCYNNDVAFDGAVAVNGDNNFIRFQNSIAWIHTGKPFRFLGLIPTPNLITITNSIVEGQKDPNNGVLDEAPQLIDPANDDYRLEVCSPAIDEGVSYGTATGKDVYGDDRVYFGTVDLGAAEFNATRISLPVPDAPNMDISASESYQDPDGWTYYYDCELRYLLFSMHTDGQDLGNPKVNIQTAATYGTSAISLNNADYLTGNEDWWVMNRRWSVTDANTFNNPVRIRFFYQQQDVQDLINSSGGVMNSIQEMTFYKVKNAQAYDEDVLAQGGTYTEYGYSNVASLNTWTDSTYNNQPYAEFLVNEFSEGSAGWLGQTALPVEWTSFEAWGQDNKVLLFWETAIEINNDYFVLEKSRDGYHFEPFVEVKSQGAGPNKYQAIDYQPFNGKNYYRIKQIDFDGTVGYSAIRVVEIGKTKDQISLYPNPVNAQLNFQLERPVEGQINARVIDRLGREVFTQKYSDGTLVNYDLELSRLPAGSYVLRVDGRRYRTFTPFVILR